MKHWQICFPERVHQAGKVSRVYEPLLPSSDAARQQVLRSYGGLNPGQKQVLTSHAPRGACSESPFSPASLSVSC